MDRRDILAERPVEKGRGLMPGVSVNPARVLFTAGLTGRNPDGSLVPGGMAPQTHRAFERLEAVLAHAGATFDDAVKQLVYVTDIEAYNAGGRAERAKFFGAARSASTGLVVRRLAEPVERVTGVAFRAVRHVLKMVERHHLRLGNAVDIHIGANAIFDA